MTPNAHSACGKLLQHTVAHACHPSIQGAETVIGTFKFSLGYTVKSCLKNTKIMQKGKFAYVPWRLEQSEDLESQRR
jgi:hypothetical protein